MIGEMKNDAGRFPTQETALPLVESGIGVAEIARNTRIVLPITFLAMALIEHAPSGMAGPSSIAPLALLSYLVALFAGVTVLLKAPYGLEHPAGLDSHVHRGISLFYGVQLGAFMIGMALSAISYVFG